jgi:Na+/proline symporter
MKLVRIIATFLFYMARILAIGYLLTALHLFVSVVFKLSTFQLLADNGFVIYYPFTDKRFLLFGFLSVFSTEDMPFFAMIVAHGIIGVFAYFLTAIFKEGVGLQSEQDLYI